MLPKNYKGERNAQVYEDYKAGADFKSMSDYFKVSIDRLKAIIEDERRRRLQLLKEKLNVAESRFSDVDSPNEQRCSA